MTASSRAPLYDLLKLIVAILLLLVFLLLLFTARRSQAGQLQEIPTATPLPATSTTVPASSTPRPPTATSTNRPTPSPTNPPTATQTATTVPSPTEAPVSETLPTPIVEIPSEVNVCEAVSRSQLQVGMKATITRPLNFRSSPGIFNNWILINNPDTPVEIIGGPSCTRYKNGGAYLWWQIKLPNGSTGWSAEASAFGTFYFMEPVK